MYFVLLFTVSAENTNHVAVIVFKNDHGFKMYINIKIILLKIMCSIQSVFGIDLNSTDWRGIFEFRCTCDNDNKELI